MTDASSTPYLLDQALELIAQVGWRTFTLVDLAQKANLPLSEIYDTFPEKSAVLHKFIEKIDKEVLAQVSPEDFNEPRRDRLLDLFMNRFQALQPHKQALRSIWDGTLSDPITSLKAAPKGLHSLQWMLEAAGYDVQGPLAPLKVNGFALLYIGVVSDWLDDDTPDQTKTMASLDRMINRLEDYLC